MTSEAEMLETFEPTAMGTEAHRTLDATANFMRPISPEPETPRPEASADPRLRTDLLKIGDDIYSIQKVSGVGLDLENELRGFYNARIEEYRRNMETTFRADVREEWEEQTNHLARITSRGEITIPENMVDHNVRWFSGFGNSGALLPVRPIIIEPSEFVGRGVYYQRWLDGADTLFARDFSHFLEGLSPRDLEHKTYKVKLKPSFKVLATVGYESRTKNLFIFDVKTPHTYIDGRICTGNTSGEEFWALDNALLSFELSRINLFSLADENYRWKSIVGGDYDRDCNIKSLLSSYGESFVEEEGGGAWTS